MLVAWSQLVAWSCLAALHVERIPASPRSRLQRTAVMVAAELDHADAASLSALAAIRAARRRRREPKRARRLPAGSVAEGLAAIVVGDGGAQKQIGWERANADRAESVVTKTTLRSRYARLHSF